MGAAVQCDVATPGSGPEGLLCWPEQQDPLLTWWGWVLDRPPGDSFVPQLKATSMVQLLKARGLDPALLGLAWCKPLNIPDLAFSLARGAVQLNIAGPADQAHREQDPGPAAAANTAPPQPPSVVPFTVTC